MEQFIKYGFFISQTDWNGNSIEIQRVDDALDLSIETGINVPQLKSDSEAVKVAMSIGFIMSENKSNKPIARFKVKQEKS